MLILFNANALRVFASPFQCQSILFTPFPLPCLSKLVNSGASHVWSMQFRRASGLCNSGALLGWSMQFRGLSVPVYANAFRVHIQSVQIVASAPHCSVLQCLCIPVQCQGASQLPFAVAFLRLDQPLHNCCVQFISYAVRITRCFSDACRGLSMPLPCCAMASLSVALFENLVRKPAHAGIPPLAESAEFSVIQAFLHKLHVVVHHHHDFKLHGGPGMDAL